MKEIDFKGKKVAVLGLGVEGVSSAKFLYKHGANVTVLDRKEKKDIDKEILEETEKIGKDILFVFGEKYLENLSTFDLIVRSPGIKRYHSKLQEAEDKGVIITSSIKLFFEFCKAKIIGVTGTKGKGTTSTLIYEMLKKGGKDAYLGGNIGMPPLDFLDKLTSDSIVVLELSSYQLQDLTKSPHIAVILMITSEHLAPDRGIGLLENYHESIEEYVDAKRNIVRYQSDKDFAVINRDYLASHESDIHTNAKIFQVSRERACRDGCYVLGDTIYTSKNGEEEEFCSTKDILLPGRHNLENVCSAIMAARLSGVSKKDIIEVLQTFRGLTHRLELVREKNGVLYYDDSFSTTPETAVAAIEAFKNPEILILGGASKGSDFSYLGTVIRESQNIKAIIGIGIEWEKIADAIGTPKNEILMIEGAKNMEQIVQAASKISKPGDVVILSPACSSFDMFKDYKDRGDQFKREVRNL